ncbi:hypothetical protein BN946_scf184985.g111 [Trametes cinnabarina]|uniref:Uncharacterized protein n=1 Tax=Pycnoporus cinnabarinus TaxID=5643 RepID=A0A060SEN9_PYCCI|nr:hypothetical protein BN946_scf184985.g111 [Trametes cinnabarina]
MTMPSLSLQAFPPDIPCLIIMYQFNLAVTLTAVLAICSGALGNDINARAPKCDAVTSTVTSYDPTFTVSHATTTITVHGNPNDKRAAVRTSTEFDTTTTTVTTTARATATERVTATVTSTATATSTSTTTSTVTSTATVRVTTTPVVSNTVTSTSFTTETDTVTATRTSTSTTTSVSTVTVPIVTAGRRG